MKAAFRRGGWTNAEIKRICEEDILKQFREVVLGRAEIKAIEHVIDCDSNPLVLNGWKVVEHKKGGQVKWNPEKVTLYLSEKQKNGKSIEGNELRKELENMPVLNANVLDHLLANPHLIPEEWKGKAIFFWGTIYRPLDGDLYVRSLHWAGSEWDWGFCWLGFDWDDDDPAALLENS